MDGMCHQSLIFCEQPVAIFHPSLLEGKACNQFVISHFSEWIFLISPERIRISSNLDFLIKVFSRNIFASEVWILVPVCKFPLMQHRSQYTDPVSPRRNYYFVSLFDFHMVRWKHHRDILWSIKLINNMVTLVCFFFWKRSLVIKCGQSNEVSFLFLSSGITGDKFQFCTELSSVN